MSESEASPPSASALSRGLTRVSAQLRPRRLWLYGLGHGKSGTSTLSEMFTGYRTGHEVGRARMRHTSAAVLRGDLGARSPQVHRALQYRNWRYRLEVDVAGNLTPVAGSAAEWFPRARFVLLIRDCFGWLDSRLEHSIRFPPDPSDDYHDALFARQHEQRRPEERRLEEQGLLPIASYLRSWSELNERVLREVPSDRLLVVRTEDLDSSRTRLADFAGVPEPTVHQAHVNRNPRKRGVLADVSRDHVVSVAQEHCGTLMRRYWGADWAALVDRDD